MVRIWITFVFFIGFFQLCSGQHITFKHITLENGLPDNLIRSIVQDKKGVVWIGSSLGVSQLNGDKIKTYALSKKGWLINKLHEDAEGTIWATTELGLYIYNPKKDEFEYWVSEDEALDKALRSNLTDIIEKNSGEIWISNIHGQLVHFSPYQKKAPSVFLLPESASPGEYISSIAKDQNGDLWLGTNHGNVLKHTSNTIFVTDFLKAENTHTIKKITYDTTNQRLWIGTLGNGLFEYDPEKSQIKHHTKKNTTNSLNDNIILSLHIDNNNNLWIGTDRGGLNLYRITKNTFSHIHNINDDMYSIPDNSVHTISSGYGNIIWVGTIHGGVSYFRNDLSINNIPPHILNFPKNDKQGSVVLEDRKGNIWLSAGRNGLRKYNPNTRKTTVFLDDPNSETGLNGDIVIALHEDAKGRIWIGTYWGGLCIYDPASKKFLTLPKENTISACFSITTDNNGQIWVGHSQGITVYDMELKVARKIHKNGPEGLSSNAIRSIYKDVKGDMWVGTRNGLNIMPKGQTKFKNYFSVPRDTTSLSSNYIVSINENKNLSVLVGTYGGGLNKFSRERDKFSRIGKEQGLEGSIIRGILTDKNANTWLSTSSGLSKITPNGRIENFGIEHGIPAFNGGAAFLSESGFLYMGNSNGLTYFKPSDLASDTLTPKIYITELRLLEDKTFRDIAFSTVPIGSDGVPEIIMLPQDDLISIDYATSDFWTPKKNTFLFKLEGLNNSWQDIGRQNVLTFANLAPGSYKLRIKVVSPSNIDGTQETLLTIKVKPSFFQMKIVKTILAISVIFGILGLFIWRIGYIKRQRNKLKLLVNEKTKEIKRQEEDAYKKDLLLMEVEKKNQELQRKKLKEELDFKIEELTNYTLRTLHKNDLLVTIKEILTKRKSAQIVKNKAQISDIVSMIDDSLILDKDWEDFYSLFNQLHPTFIKHLKMHYPQLTEREVKLCSLIKLNFPSQHIATLFGISLGSVKVARHRLRKKLSIVKDEDFATFFDKET